MLELINYRHTLLQKRLGFTTDWSTSSATNTLDISSVEWTLGEIISGESKAYCPTKLTNQDIVLFLGLVSFLVIFLVSKSFVQKYQNR